MWPLVARRLLMTMPTLLGASLVVFAMVKLAPGDPISILMPPDAGKTGIEAVKEALGLDRPLPVQYLKWLERAAVHGDLGRPAVASGRPFATAQCAKVEPPLREVSSRHLAACHLYRNERHSP